MTFRFDQYTVRPVADRDRDYLDSLIKHDLYHHDVMSADWFFDLRPGEDAWAIENDNGEVILYFKTQTAVRLSLQFGEQPASVNRDALTKGMKWLEGMLTQNQFREVIFDTMGPGLKALAKRRLGFAEAEPGTLVRLLPSPEGYKRSLEVWHHEPTPFQEGG